MSGSLTENGTGYTLYWSGRTKEERHLSGVGFMMKAQIANKLHSLPIGYSDQLMSLCHTRKQVCYPHQRLHSNPTEGGLLQRPALPPPASQTQRQRHNVGNCNDNGCLLLALCSEHELTITNTMFQQKDRYKTTWKHPWSKHWHRWTTSPPDSTTQETYSTLESCQVLTATPTTDSSAAKWPSPSSLHQRRKVPRRSD